MEKPRPHISLDAIFVYPTEKNLKEAEVGGSDGTRTRGLLRDSQAF